MEKSRKICNFNSLVFSLLLIAEMIAIPQQQFAKIKPTKINNRLSLFKKAQSLDQGMNLSWLEQTWNKEILNDTAIHESDFILLKKLGFASIRLPVAFTFFEQTKVPVDTVFKRIDKVLGLCKRYNLTLVIDYHYGNLKNDNYLTETPKIIELWQNVARRYQKESVEKLFFEIYNEPTVSDQIWKDAAYNIVTGIRKVDKMRTLLVGASNYNSIYELSRFERLADDNVIYTIHFYEPFFFTHQGAEWVGSQTTTTGVPFPYNEEKFPSLNVKTKNTWGETNYYQYRNDGNEQSMVDKLTKYVVPWSAKYNVPVVCTEYGAYKKYADQDSRCHYIKAIRKTLQNLKIPGIMWEYNGSFSIFEGRPSISTLPDCMKDALGYHN